MYDVITQIANEFQMFKDVLELKMLLFIESLDFNNSPYEIHRSIGAHSGKHRLGYLDRHASMRCERVKEYCLGVSVGLNEFAKRVPIDRIFNERDFAGLCHL